MTTKSPYQPPRLQYIAGCLPALLDGFSSGSVDGDKKIDVEEGNPGTIYSKHHTIWDDEEEDHTP